MSKRSYNQRSKPTSRPPLRQAPVTADAPSPIPAEAPPQLPPEPFTYPSHWSRGQLLNCRQAPEGWYFMLLGDGEYDHREPERGLFLSQYMEAQGFQSWWYARDSADPRAR